MGKSTFFNVLCDMHVEAENRPFCTIDPNVAQVPVPVRGFMGRYAMICYSFSFTHTLNWPWHTVAAG